jgi:hypothetical protein
VNAYPESAGAAGRSPRPSFSFSTNSERMASTAVWFGSDWRNTSLKTSSDSGPEYPVARTSRTNSARSNAPCPGKSRW